jgi:hypothetical protein
VAAKLAAIAPPAGLRDAILAGGRVSVSARPWWARRETLAMAAAVAVAIGAGTMALRPSRATAATDPLASYALADVNPHEGHGAAVAALQTAMKNPAMRLSAALPVDFAELERTGCRTVLVGNRPVLEVCFQREGRWFHCYIGRCEDFPELPTQQAPEFASSGEMTAATWANGTYRLVVAGRAGREIIERLL